MEMLNDARVASFGFFKENICTTRINKEKKFKIKFQVLLKFAQILLDYIDLIVWRYFTPRRDIIIMININIHVLAKIIAKTMIWDIILKLNDR